MGGEKDRKKQRQKRERNQRNEERKKRKTDRQYKTKEITTEHNPIVVVCRLLLTKT